MKRLLAILSLLLTVSIASAQPGTAKPPPEKVYPTGVIVPANIKERVAASWKMHGARMMATPTVTASKWDAADFGLDSPVDDQGDCGSCHLFGGAGAVEDAQLKEGHKAIRLSKQAVMDWGNTGDCNGGWPEDTLAFAKKTGIPTTGDYGPYVARRKAGKPLTGMKLFKLATYGYVGREDGVPTYQQLKDAMVKYGPLVVAVSADNRFMNADPDKVFDGNASGINHAVMLTGWDDNKDGGPAIKMKNSWSTQWGKSGYLWMRPGANRIGYGAMWCVAEDTLPDPSPDPSPSPVPSGKVKSIVLTFDDGTTDTWTRGITPSGKTVPDGTPKEVIDFLNNFYGPKKADPEQKKEEKKSCTPAQSGFERKNLPLISDDPRWPNMTEADRRAWYAANYPVTTKER